MEKISQNQRVLILLSLVLIAAFALRVPGLKSREIILHDEGAHLMEAAFLYDAYSESVTVHAEKEPWMVSHLFGYPPFTGKIGHVLLIRLFMFLTGPVPLAGTLLAIVAGLLSIAAVFFLGRHLGGDVLGVFSSICLAVSGYHIMYSRSLLPETDSSLLYLVSLLVYSLAISKKRPYLLLIMVGLFSGSAYVVNNRWFVIPVLFLVSESVLAFLNRAEVPVTRSASGAAVLFASMAFPLMIAEMITRFLSSSLGGIFTGLRVQSFLGQILGKSRKFSGLHGFDLSLKGFWINLMHFVRLDNILLTLLLLAGVLLILRTVIKKRDPAWTVVSIHLIFMLLFFSLYYFNYFFPRNLSLALPLVAVAQGVALVRVFEFARGLLPNKRAFVAGGMILVLVTVTGVFNSRQVLSYSAQRREAIRRTCDQIVSQNLAPVSVYHLLRPIWGYYVNEYVREKKIHPLRVARYGRGIFTGTYINDPFVLMGMKQGDVERSEKIIESNEYKLIAEGSNTWFLFQPYVDEMGLTGKINPAWMREMGGGSNSSFSQFKILLMRENGKNKNSPEK